MYITIQAIASPNYILPPGMTMPASLVPICAIPSTLTQPEDFLNGQNRCVYDVLPDGNCMFRSLSHQLCGSDKHHTQLRHTLLEQIQNNYITYQPYWIEDMPCGKMMFDEHLESLAKDGSWGTQVELQATSDCFNLDIFVSSPNPSHIIRWERKAIPRHHNTIMRPSLKIVPTLPFTSNHLELSFYNSHYKSVVPKEKDVKLPPPVIISRSSDLILITN